MEDKNRLQAYLFILQNVLTSMCIYGRVFFFFFLKKNHKPNDFVFFVDFQVRTLELVLRKLFVYINDTRFKIIYKGKLTSSHTKVEKKKIKKLYIHTYN
jgi:hypothetical protein